MWANKEKNVTQENTKILNISYLQCKEWKKNKSIWILEIFYMERKCLLKEVTQFTCDKKTQIFHIRKNPKPKRTLVSWRNLRYLQVKNFLHSIWSKGATLLYRKSLHVSCPILNIFSWATIEIHNVFALFSFGQAGFLRRALTFLSV